MSDSHFQWVNTVAWLRPSGSHSNMMDSLRILRSPTCTKARTRGETGCESHCHAAPCNLWQILWWRSKVKFKNESGGGGSIAGNILVSLIKMENNFWRRSCVTEVTGSNVFCYYLGSYTCRIVSLLANVSDSCGHRHSLNIRLHTRTHLLNRPPHVTQRCIAPPSGKKK